MAAALSANRDLLTKLTPGGATGLAGLTDEELLANTRRLVGSSNQLLAACSCIWQKSRRARRPSHAPLRQPVHVLHL
jgi:hypothetical protein